MTTKPLLPLRAFAWAAVALTLPLALPSASAKATPKPAPTFGGFAKGKKFSFSVSELLSQSTTGSTVIDPAPIAAGIPKFKLGQKVTFTIGPKGELTGSGFKIPLVAASASVTSNNYVTAPSAKNPSPNSAIVFKSANGEPSAISLHFFTVKIKKFVPTVNAVVYELK